MMKYSFIVAACLLVALSGCTGTKPQTIASGRTQVMLLATLHNFHKTNPNYSYDDVYTIIRNYNPDIIGIEIRPEDIDRDTTYLKQIYPLEMRQITVLFDKGKVHGLDWYGEEAVGKPLSPDAFKGGNKELTQIKQLEQAMNADTTLTSRMKMIAVFMQKMQEIAKTASPAELNNSGSYDLTAELFYKQMDVMMQDTPYKTYTNFNRQRDIEIGKNITNLIRQNPGRKLIFIVGANHRFAARQTIENTFGNTVDLVPVPEL